MGEEKYKVGVADKSGGILEAFMNAVRRNSTNSSISRFVDIAPRLARTMLIACVSQMTVDM